MSKKMTPCEKLGYKAGDKFEVIEDSVYFKKGEIVSLRAADNSSCPFFINEKVVRDGYRKGCAMYLSSVRKISKLKPAKQALADAINQNGGLVEGGDWHKNGELPPVGAFVDVVGNDLVYGVGESNCEVIAHVENTAVIRMSYGLGCFEFGAITPARTERDKAIDEMVDCLSSRWANCDEIAAHLYENGYRKEVK